MLRSHPGHVPDAGLCKVIGARSTMPCPWICAGSAIDASERSADLQASGFRTHNHPDGLRFIPSTSRFGFTPAFSVVEICDNWPQFFKASVRSSIYSYQRAVIVVLAEAQQELKLFDARG